MRDVCLAIGPRRPKSDVAVGPRPVYISEKTWKTHRVGAVALMATVNGIRMAVVASNNRNGARG